MWVRIILLKLIQLAKTIDKLKNYQSTGIHFLLPPVKSSEYCLKAKGHSYELPRCEYDMNYIKSLLFHDVCIEIVTVKQSALSLFSFLKVGFICVYVSIFLCVFYFFPTDV